MSKKRDMPIDLSGVSRDVLERFGLPDIMGLGSGSTVAQFVKLLARESRRRRVSPVCIPTSLQIEQVLRRSGLHIGSSGLVPEVKLVVDGADQVDQNLAMIKGGGGALLREKVLHRATKKLVIIVGEEKVGRKLSHPIPIEILPYAQSLVERELRKMGGGPILRVLEKGYPFVTDNGNIILDTDLGKIVTPQRMEEKVKGIPGVLEVGIFTRRPNAVYVLRSDGSYRVLS